MGKCLNFAAAAAAAGLVAATSAAAQTSNAMPGSAAPGSRAILEAIGAPETTAMMAELGVATQIVRAPGVAQPGLLAVTEGGGRFLFNFGGCADPEALTRCDSVIVSTAVPAGGLTYENINDFNGGAAVTTAVNVPGEQIVVFGRNIIVAGGHSRELFQATVVLFLLDVAGFAQTNAGVASAGFARETAQGGKISGRTDAPASPPPFGLGDLSLHVAAAIDNTDDVDFAVRRPR